MKKLSWCLNLVLKISIVKHKVTGGCLEGLGHYVGTSCGAQGQVKMLCHGECCSSLFQHPGHSDQIGRQFSSKW